MMNEISYKLLFIRILLRKTDYVEEAIFCNSTPEVFSTILSMTSVHDIADIFLIINLFITKLNRKKRNNSYS